MTKNEMENEKNNKSTGINQGKGSTPNAGADSSGETGAGAAKGMASGSGSGSEGSGSGTGAGRSSTVDRGSEKMSTQGKSSVPGQDKTSDVGVLEQVQESGKDLASKSLAAIGEKTRSATEGYKSEITGGLHTLAEGLRQTSSTFQRGSDDTPLATAGGRYLGDLADKIESVSGYFERKDAAALMSDVKGFARRNPTVFVGASFAAGFALSRLIRSSMAAPSTNSVSASPLRG